LDDERRKEIKRYNYNSLFRPGPNSNLNACVGTNGGPYDFGSYGEGFFEAGFQIVEAIKQGAWTTDILIYPAVFDFRHGIELYIKHMTILANRLLGTGRRMAPGHGILQNWSSLTQLFADLHNPHFDALEIDIVKDILIDFVEIDATGQVFRYPEDNKGQPHLREISVINVEVLADGMRDVFDLFETWHSGLVALLEENHLSTNSVHH